MVSALKFTSPKTTLPVTELTWRQTLNALSSWQKQSGAVGKPVPNVTVHCVAPDPDTKLPWLSDELAPIVGDPELQETVGVTEDDVMTP